MSSTQLKKQKDFFWPKIVEIYQQVFSVFRKDPTVWMLFGIVALFDVGALISLYLAPSPPFSYVIAPVIRTFWGDKFLHYPNNFILLPKLLNHAHLVISTVVGVFVSGLVIKKIEGQVVEGEHISLLEASQPVVKKYFSLICVWLLSYFLFVLPIEHLLPILTKNVWLQFSIAFIFSVFIQALVAFLLPALVLLEKGFFRGIWEGLSFGVRHFLTASGLIFIPMLLIAILSFFKLLTPYYLKFYHELALWVLFVGIIVMAVVDFFITSSATILFLKARNQEK